MHGLYKQKAAEAKTSAVPFIWCFQASDPSDIYACLVAVDVEGLCTRGLLDGVGKRLGLDVICEVLCDCLNFFVSFKAYDYAVHHLEIPGLAQLLDLGYELSCKALLHQLLCDLSIEDDADAVFKSNVEALSCRYGGAYHI